MGAVTTVSKKELPEKTMKKTLHAYKIISHCKSFYAEQYVGGALK